jgi:hypothetical protein
MQQRMCFFCCVLSYDIAPPISEGRRSRALSSPATPPPLAASHNTFCLSCRQRASQTGCQDNSSIHKSSIKTANHKAKSERGGKTKRKCIPVELLSLSWYCTPCTGHENRGHHHSARDVGDETTPRGLGGFKTGYAVVPQQQPKSKGSKLNNTYRDLLLSRTGCKGAWPEE